MHNLFIRIEDAAVALNLSRPSLFVKIKSGDVPAPDFRSGLARGWRVDTLVKWFPAIKPRLDTLINLPPLLEKPPFWQ